MNKQTFINNTKAAFEKIGYNTGHGFITKLAEKYGVSSPAANEWFNVNRTSYPRLEILCKMSEDTGVSINQLLFGNLEAEIKQYKVPIYPINKISKIDFSTRTSEREAQPEEWIAFADFYNPKLFGIRQFGDSMLSPNGISFAENTIVVFNADKKNPPNGGLILASIDDEKVIFRRYINEGTPFLMPLNNNYENYTGQFNIIGCFEYAIIKT